MTPVSCVVARRFTRLGMEPPAVLSAHVRRCLTCQAEAARVRRLSRAMALMGAATVPAPPDLMDLVRAAAAPAAAGRSRAAEGPPRVVTAAAATTAVAGAIAVVVAVRRRAQTAITP